ncbi:MAG TPA: protein kinase [Blastocatellia bacterium]|nr:protein kinase [Blastocatellia bacterium]
MVGKTILHYRILKEIGKGGMGVVYKAEDTKLHRAVAIKALSADLVGDQKARSRFMREARAASAIDHPNICTVYEINEVDGVLFFVMPFVEGKTLKKFIGGRPVPLDLALEFSLQLVDALAEAHRSNVLHRDIKSSNVMLNERNQVKVLDFGLAKLTDADAQGEPEFPGGGDITQLGTPFGTASYMSPEQAKGEAADARSDLFSLGIVMYEMFTGRLPFKGKSSVEVMHAVINDEPAPLGDEAPPGLQTTMTRLLAKNPAARYQTAGQVLEDLRALVRGHYAEKGVIPADKSASFGASTQREKGKGLIGRAKDWVQRTFSVAAPQRDEVSSGTPSATPDLTPSAWQSRDKQAIAILPFKNLSGSPETEFYSFSLADSVITELAQLHELIVRPSSYIAQYQNKDVDPRIVGTQLAVDAVLIGGYLKAGDRFRVTPQLVDVTSGEIVWSEKIDVDARDIITVQDTISRRIVEGLRVKTSSDEQERLVKKSPTENAEGYESYLKGRTLLYKFTTQTLDKSDLDSAVSMFNNAIKQDPNFALAHSGIGVCLLEFVLKGMGGLDYFGRAKKSFQLALQTDSTLVEPRVRLVYIDLIEGKSERARAEIARLLRHAPNEPSVHSAAAYVYRLSGQYERALEQWDLLLRINPTDVVFASYNRARIYIYQHDYDKAGASIATGLAFEPNHPNLRTYGALVDYYRGEIEKATIVLEDVLARNPDLHSHPIFLAFCYLAKGDRERALGLIDDQVRATGLADQDVAYRLATVYAIDGDSELAFEWLDRAISMGNENYPWFTSDPHWTSLREDPRHKAIMESLKAKWERVISQIDLTQP